jgi:hypothetical protein
MTKTYLNLVVYGRSPSIRAFKVFILIAVHREQQSKVIFLEELPVLFGVPQGSVLSPWLFLTHINDLPDSIKCRAHMLADVTIGCHQTIRSKNDPSNPLKRLDLSRDLRT